MCHENTVEAMKIHGQWIFHIFPGYSWVRKVKCGANCNKIGQSGLSMHSFYFFFIVYLLMYVHYTYFLHDAYTTLTCTTYNTYVTIQLHQSNWITVDLFALFFACLLFESVIRILFVNYTKNIGY